MIRFFSDIKKEDIALVGGKGANLGEMFEHFPIPNGFVITTKAYDNFLELKGLTADLKRKVQEIEIGDHTKLENASNEIKKMLLDELIHEALIKEIEQGLTKLEGDKFAVRSSATAEDLLTASFAGQQDTFLEVSRAEIVEKVQKCWASLYNPRAIYYRSEKKIDQDVSMAVVVQEMVDADFAGVMFTYDPIEKKNILIEAATGLGEKVVSGEVTPSSFMLDRGSFEIVDKSITYEIDESIVQEIGKIGLQIESHYQLPQDIEFAVKNGKIYILQSRAITT